MSIDSRMRSRRALLTTVAGSAGVIAASALIAPARALAHDPDDLALNADNPVTADTGVTQATADVTAFHATSASGIGIKAVSSSVDTVDHALSTGVYATSGDAASAASDTRSTGVYGFAGDDANPISAFPTGVWGDSVETGVYGTGGYVGVEGDGGLFGVIGMASDDSIPTAVGVLAAAATTAQRALRVSGRAEFTRSGRAYFPANTSSTSISVAGMTAHSLVFAMLTSNRSGIYIRAVSPTTGKFTAYLNSKVTTNTYFSWIAFTNPINHSG